MRFVKIMTTIMTFQELADTWILGHGEEILDLNPANPNHVLARIKLFTPEDVSTALDIAERSFQSWSKLPAPKRGEILLRAGELIEKDAEKLALLITLPESTAAAADAGAAP